MEVDVMESGEGHLEEMLLNGVIDLVIENSSFPEALFESAANGQAPGFQVLAVCEIVGEILLNGQNLFHRVQVFLPHIGELDGGGAAVRKIQLFEGIKLTEIFCSCYNTPYTRVGSAGIPAPHR